MLLGVFRLEAVGLAKRSDAYAAPIRMPVALMGSHLAAPEIETDKNGRGVDKPVLECYRL